MYSGVQIPELHLYCIAIASPTASPTEFVTEFATEFATAIFPIESCARHCIYCYRHHSDIVFVEERCAAFPFDINDF